MRTYPDIGTTTNSLRPEERIGAFGGAQEVDSLDWREVQIAFKSLSKVWDPAKGLAQTLLQQRARALGPVRYKGLQEVRNVDLDDLWILITSNC